MLNSKPKRNSEAETSCAWRPCTRSAVWVVTPSEPLLYLCDAHARVLAADDFGTQYFFAHIDPTEHDAGVAVPLPDPWEGEIVYDWLITCEDGEFAVWPADTFMWRIDSDSSLEIREIYNDREMVAVYDGMYWKSVERMIRK